MNTYKPHGTTQEDKNLVTGFMDQLRRLGPNPNKSTVAIAVRHFVHPKAPHLALQLMELAAEAVGEEVDGRGVWTACNDEIWLPAALCVPQQFVPREA